MPFILVFSWLKIFQRSFIYLFIHVFTSSFIYLFIYSFIIYLLIHSFFLLSGAGFNGEKVCTFQLDSEARFSKAI